MQISPNERPRPPKAVLPADDVVALTAKVERLQAVVNKAREYVRHGRGSDYEALRELLIDGCQEGHTDG